MLLKVFFLYCVSLLHAAVMEGDECNSNGVKGTCTLITKCPSAVEQIKKREGPEICGFVGTLPLVCCLQNRNPSPQLEAETKPQSLPVKPAGDDVENGTHIGGCENVPEFLTSKKTGQKAFDKCIQYQADYVYPCKGEGETEVPRANHCYNTVNLLIVGLNDTQKYEFSHMVMLGYGDSEQSVSWKCAGSIISDRFILTAGHCTFHIILGEPKFVLVGAHTGADANDTSKVFKVKRIIKHPQYKPPRRHNDIALLETEKRLPLSKYVVPACLHVGDPVRDERVFATGWGLNTDEGSRSGAMQKIILNKFTTEECSAIYPNYRHNGFDAQTQTCYGYKTGTVETCQGDNGGPIQIKSQKIHCMYTMVGVTSFGRKCGLIAEPAIYTKVSYYVPWIESIVWP